jgi:hypothetical protein
MSSWHQPRRAAGAQLDVGLEDLVLTPSTAMPSSPTAAAQRFTEPERTSPAAKMPV